MITFQQFFSCFVSFFLFFLLACYTDCAENSIENLQTKYLIFTSICLKRRRKRKLLFSYLFIVPVHYVLQCGAYKRRQQRSPPNKNTRKNMKIINHTHFWHKKHELLCYFSFVWCITTSRSSVSGSRRGWWWTKKQKKLYCPCCWLFLLLLLLLMFSKRCLFARRVQAYNNR